MGLHSRLSHLTLVAPENDVEFTDALWRQLRLEAEQAYARSPMLAPLFLDSILNQPSFEAAMFHRIAGRLKNDVISQPLILQAFHRAAGPRRRSAWASRPTSRPCSTATRPANG